MSHSERSEPGQHSERSEPGQHSERSEPGQHSERSEPGADDEISPFDTTVARQARIYDYLLGGKDNFAADREAATQAIAAFPGLVTWAQAEPGVPGPGRALPGVRGGHPAVP